MKLIIKTNPIFYEDNVIEGYRKFSSAVLPTIVGQVQLVAHKFYAASINLIYPPDKDKRGDVSDNNPHSTWIAYASVFNGRRDALIWLSYTTREWAQELGGIVSLPRHRCFSAEETRNSTLPMNRLEPVRVADSWDYITRRQMILTSGRRASAVPVVDEGIVTGSYRNFLVQSSFTPGTTFSTADTWVDESHQLNFPPPIASENEDDFPF